MAAVASFAATRAPPPSDAAPWAATRTIESTAPARRRRPLQSQPHRPGRRPRSAARAARLGRRARVRGVPVAAAAALDPVKCCCNKASEGGPIDCNRRCTTKLGVAAWPSGARRARYRAAPSATDGLAQLHPLRRLRRPEVPIGDGSYSSFQAAAEDASRLAVGALGPAEERVPPDQDVRRPRRRGARGGGWRRAKRGAGSTAPDGRGAAGGCTAAGAGTWELNASPWFNQLSYRDRYQRSSATAKLAGVEKGGVEVLPSVVAGATHHARLAFEPNRVGPAARARPRGLAHPGARPSAPLLYTYGGRVGRAPHRSCTSRGRMRSRRAPRRRWQPVDGGVLAFAGGAESRRSSRGGSIVLNGIVTTGLCGSGLLLWAASLRICPRRRRSRRPTSGRRWATIASCRPA